MNSERKAFEEQWAKHNGLQLMLDWDDDRQQYAYDITHTCFSVWQASTSRQGYKLVPVRPTEEMIYSGFIARVNGSSAINIYQAMIGAFSNDH